MQIFNELPHNDCNYQQNFVMGRFNVGFVEEVDQVEQLRNRIADLEAQLHDKEQQLNHEKQNSDRKLRTLTENLPVILYTLDTEGIVTLSEGKGLAAIGSKPGQSV